MDKPITLIGMMAAGKTTIGRNIANTLGCPFIDSDQLIETKTKKTISHIFRHKGEQQFRLIETDVIATLLRQQPYPYILAVGGGAFCHASTRIRLKRHTLTLWLDVPLSILKRRLRQPDQLRHRPLASQFDRLYRRRGSAYRQAHHRLTITDETPQDIATTIIRHYA